MKKQLLISAVISMAFLTSCMSVKQIGSVNMISTRNIDPSLNYKVISTYSGGSQKELKKSRATTIQDAIDKTVRKVAGGEFLMNAKIYLVNGKYLAVEGDVWGSSTTEIAYRGFKIGDKVTWKKGGNYRTGVITSLKDDKTCLIKDDLSQEISEQKYDDITKTIATTTTTTSTITTNTANTNIITSDSLGGFKTGDKVKFWDMGKNRIGIISRIVGDRFEIIYTNSNDKAVTVKKDLGDLTKVQ